MDNHENLWEKFFPNAKISHADKKRIYNLFKKDFPNDSFSDYLKGFKQINPNYDWKKFIDVFLPHINQKQGSFPDSLLFTKKSYPIPGTPFSSNPPEILNEFQISASANQSFLAKFRNIFKQTTVTFTSGGQARGWLGGPNFSYWPQQLNFAVWCATSGCGVSLGEKYPPMIHQFLQFHVYFTIRRILYELGVPLPDDKAFNQTNNIYNKIAYNALCKEFNINSTADFRWNHGKNNGLGNVWIMYPDDNWNYNQPWKSEEKYPGVGFKFSDEKRKAEVYIWGSKTFFKIRFDLGNTFF